MKADYHLISASCSLASARSDRHGFAAPPAHASRYGEQYGVTGIKTLFDRFIWSLIGTFLVVNYAHAEIQHETTTIECKLPGCQVSCVFKETSWKSFGHAESIEMTIYKNGSTKLILNKGLDGNNTIIVGPKGYICSIENQKN